MSEWVILELTEGVSTCYSVLKISRRGKDSLKFRVGWSCLSVPKLIENSPDISIDINDLEFKLQLPLLFLR